MFEIFRFFVGGGVGRAIGLFFPTIGVLIIFAGALYTLGKEADDITRKSFKRLIASKLKKMGDPQGASKEIFSTFTIILNRFLGESWLSKKSLLTSSIVSLFFSAAFVLLLQFALDCVSSNDRSPALRFLASDGGFFSSVLLVWVGGVIPDYISLIRTRFIANLSAYASFHAKLCVLDLVVSLAFSSIWTIFVFQIYDEAFPGSWGSTGINAGAGLLLFGGVTSLGASFLGCFLLFTTYIGSMPNCMELDPQQRCVVRGQG